MSRNKPGYLYNNTDDAAGYHSHQKEVLAILFKSLEFIIEHDVS
jgi:hypothetical protein